MEENLVQFLRRQWPDADRVEVQEFAVIAGGYSRETYRFDCCVRRGETTTTYPMILRKDPPPLAAILPTSRQMEHDLIRRVKEHTSIPVAECHFVEMDTATFGTAAMLIERAKGFNEPSQLFNGGANEDQAESVATHLCELIAELHSTDPKLLNPDGKLDDPRGEGIDVSSWERYMDTSTEYYVRTYKKLAWTPLPTFYDGYLQLRRTRPRPLPLVVVHGDFNPSNFLYQDGRVTALIDWENSHIGDRREDLGWLMLMDQLSNTSVFASVKEDGGFLGHYNKITGMDLTMEEVGYYSMYTGGNIGIPVGSAVKRRMDKEHDEFLHMYLMQPFTASGMIFATLMGYPLAPQGGA